MWKEKIDLQIFERLMEQCNMNNCDKNMRYIKFISEESDENCSSKNIIDNEQPNEADKEITTGDKTELSETTSSADQMFLETTV